MHLAELIPATTTDAAVLEGLETFLVTTLGKGVVYAKDTPNFIGNRIGVFSILSAMHHTAAVRPGLRRSGCADRPADRPAEVGHLPHRPTWSAWTPWPTSSRPWPTPCPTIRGTATSSRRRGWQALIAKGALGQKTGAGIFRKVGKDIVVLDLETQDYRAADRAAVAPEVAEILKLKNPAEKFARLRASEHPQAQFLWAVLPRPVPLQRLPPGRHRRHRARRRPGDPLGLRLVAGPVRDLAGRRLEAGGGMDRR